MTNDAPKTASTPQEIAAQILNAYPYYDDYFMSNEQAKHLGTQANQLRTELENMKPYLLSDAELMPKLADVQDRAVKSGIWRADKGAGAEDRIHYAMHKYKDWGYSDKEARASALKELRAYGYADAIRLGQKEQEQIFTAPVREYINNHHINTQTEKKEIGALRERTIDITALNPHARAALSADFPSGNFLYHGTDTERLVQILDSGILANTKALRQRESEAARVQGRKAGIVTDNSGYEGVSWSMNRIDALPGDRYHLAGFVAAPESVLGSGRQLAVPSRPSPNEVVLIDDTIDVQKYYAAKTQLELYESYENNSVLGGLIAMIARNQDEPSKLLGIVPNLQNQDYVNTLRKNYSIAQNGTIALNPDLLDSPDAATEIPVAAVWIQGLVDASRLAGTDFEGMTTAAVIVSIGEDNIRQLYTLLHKDVDTHAAIWNVKEAAIAVPVEQLYFVASRKDASLWLQVMARSQHKPAGILLYDEAKVRLENFASLHRGDHQALTAQLQSAIRPDNPRYIDYNQVLGLEFNDTMRTGHKHQIIAEKYLGNRAVIKKANGKLIVER